MERRLSSVAPLHRTRNSLGYRVALELSCHGGRWRAGGRTIWISSGESSSSTPPPSSHELPELPGTSDTLFSAGNKTDGFCHFPSKRRNQSTSPSEAGEKPWPLHCSAGIQSVGNGLQAGDDQDGNNKCNILLGSVVLYLHTAGS